MADSGGMAGGDGGAGPGAGDGRRWDVALSFAGAQRDYVSQVAAALKAREVRCFYDADEQVRLWGTYLAEELSRIYAEESAAVVVFISADYAGGEWTRLERRAALARAVAEAGVYVLPARFDDSRLPGLLPDVVTVDLRRYTPAQFAGLIAEKVAGLAGSPPGGSQAGIGPTVGRMLAEVRDPFALEVHRPVQPEDAPAGLPELPAYVPRGHDQLLAGVVRAAAGGRSGVAVLVGGSSVGKTRACWEALDLLRDEPEPWRLWHPIDPSRPAAALRELPGIGPRTVVWLNEAQFYLEAADGMGEGVAAGLRELLRDPARAPVLVLATLWPQYWDELTIRPAGGSDVHDQARELLDGHDITVPAAFAAAQLQQLSQAGDARLAQAAAGAQDGQVIQFLAGAPELLARYRNAPPAATALIHAAMDARRLGTGIALPQAFLEAAAHGYLTDTEWDALDDDWVEQALRYTAKDTKGVRGPLTPIRPRPARPHAPGPGSKDRDEQLAGSLYRLADYLDQHGRHHRKSQIPPAGFWAAAADHAFPGDQATLGDAAHARGLYRDAAQLHKNAAAYGNLDSVFYFYYFSVAAHLRSDVRSMRWAVAHVPLDHPGAVAGLLGSLREAGAQEQAAALLHRDPAAHAALDDPDDVAGLLDRLRVMGAQEQVTALAERAAAHVPLDDPGAVAGLLNGLREAGAQEQASALAERAAAHAPLDEPAAVAVLLGSLRKAGAQEQAAALLRRDPAAHVSLDDMGAVAWLLDRLREAGAQEQAAALLARDPAAHAALDDPDDVAGLLGSLRAAGAAEQAAALAERAAAHAPLDDMGAVAWLLDGLRAAGAAEQAAALADRAAAQVPLGDMGDVAGLLDRLRAMGAQEQVTALAERDPPPTPPSTTRAPWPGCWTACGRRARRSRPPRCWPVILPPTPPSTTRATSPCCWAACGPWARRSRPPR